MSITTRAALTIALTAIPAGAEAKECRLDRFDAMRVASVATGSERADTAVFRSIQEEGAWVVFISDRNPGQEEWVLEVNCNSGSVLKMTAGISEEELRGTLSTISAPAAQKQVAPLNCHPQEDLEPID